MFVWQPDDDNYDDDLGDYWTAIVRYLESNVRHSLESFILPVDHDNIRVFREALNGPAGRNTNRSINQAPDFWDEKVSDMNLKHNKIARQRLGMEDKARSQTQWGPFGEMQVPWHYWLEYMKCNSQRRLDMLDGKFSIEFRCLYYYSLLNSNIIGVCHTFQVFMHLLLVMRNVTIATLQVSFGIYPKISAGRSTAELVPELPAALHRAEILLYLMQAAHY